jgi:hypothetical protein
VLGEKLSEGLMGRNSNEAKAYWDNLEVLTAASAAYANGKEGSGGAELLKNIENNTALDRLAM